LGWLNAKAILTWCIDTNQTYLGDFQSAELKLPTSQVLSHFVHASLADLEFPQGAQQWLLGARNSDITKSL